MKVLVMMAAAGEAHQWRLQAQQHHPDPHRHQRRLTTPHQAREGGNMSVLVMSAVAGAVRQPLVAGEAHQLRLQTTIVQHHPDPHRHRRRRTDPHQALDEGRR